MGDVLSSIGKQLDLGEIFLKTPFGSYIKMNNDNSIDIHTGSSTALFLDNLANVAGVILALVTNSVFFIPLSIKSLNKLLYLIFILLSPWLLIIL